MIPAGDRPPAPRPDRSPPCRFAKSRTTAPAVRATAITPASDSVVRETHEWFGEESPVARTPPGTDFEGVPSPLDSLAGWVGFGPSGRATAAAVTTRRQAAAARPVL